MPRKSLPEDLKFSLYEASVQDTEHDIKVLTKIFREIHRRDPLSLREDFCGTFRLSSEWVKSHQDRRAYALDLDPRPLRFGKEIHYRALSDSQKKRIKIFQKNVLSVTRPRTDMAVAMNFSPFFFRTRDLMRKYFSVIRKSLVPKGLFVTDLMGGNACQEPNEDREKFRWNGKSYTYFWEQKDFDPITNHSHFSIHFGLPNGRKVKDVFQYPWRLWTIPEIRELLIEAGFRKTYVYWEGNTRDGDGNGIFTRKEMEKSAEVWIALVVGVP